MKLKARSLSVAALVLVSTPAFAQEPPAPPPAMESPAPTPPPPPAREASSASGLGAAGQIAIEADIPFGNEAPQFAIVHQSGTMGAPGVTLIGIAPSLDYFVAPSVSLGGIIGFASGSASANGVSADSTAFIVGARVGYNVSLSEAVSIWGRIGLQYVHNSTSAGGQSFSGYSVPLIVEAPILWHPAPHFFLGAGPILTTELVNKVMDTDQVKTTNIGVTLMIGGYFGGT